LECKIYKQINLNVTEESKQYFRINENVFLNDI